MGRQVVFYMLSEDLPAFEGWLRGFDADIVMLVDPMTGPELRTTDTILTIPRDFGMRSLARREDLPLMRRDYVPTQGYNMLNRTFSPVVEFTRGYFDEKANRLRSGLCTTPPRTGARAIRSWPSPRASWRGQRGSSRSSGRARASRC